MAHMIEVTKKVYNDADILENEMFSINADNINKIEKVNLTWENSIICMNDDTTIYAAETVEEINHIINNR